MYLRYTQSFAAIFGCFALGLYIAIQGPTLMDLIDILHVNNDLMSYSMACASLAYSLGGLLSGILFNYVSRQVLMACYFIVFGTINIITPHLSNFMVYSVITVLKMMCAGGTDCASNVWILEMWPGQDAWLQGLHFSFAFGCAFAPLIAEPFLSSEAKESLEPFEKLAGKNSGSATFSETNDSKVWIPYSISGVFTIATGIFILVLFFVKRRHEAKLRLCAPGAGAQKVNDGHILMGSTAQLPGALEAGLGRAAGAAGAGLGNQKLAVIVEQPSQEQQQTGGEPPVQASLAPSSKQVGQSPLAGQAVFGPQTPTPDNSSGAPGVELAVALQAANKPAQKITSKECERADGRRPYYVMFAIILCALCLSFYCGIEITSMNYLATFIVSIDLQLPKSTAAYMSSALTISFAVGRGLGVWAALYMKPHKVFYLCAVVMSVGNVLMLLFANTHESILWISICVFGVGCGPMYPAIVSFYDDKISKVTNSVAGFFILGSMFNVSLNSLIIGHRIEDYALILIICNLIGSISLALLFMALHMLTKVKKNQRVRKFKLRQEKEAASLLSQKLAQQQQLEKCLPALGQQQEEQESPAEGAAALAKPSALAPVQVHRHHSIQDSEPRKQVAQRQQDEQEEDRQREQQQPLLEAGEAKRESDNKVSAADKLNNNHNNSLNSANTSLESGQILAKDMNPSDTNHNVTATMPIKQTAQETDRQSPAINQAPQRSEVAPL